MALATAERVEPCSTRCRSFTTWIVGFAIGAIVVGAGCRSSHEPAPSETALTDDEVVAFVDGAEIRGKAVADRVEALRHTFSARDGSASTISIASAQLRVLDELMDEKLAAAGASRAGIVVTDAEVDARLAATPDPRPWAGDAARAQLRLERLAGAASAPPSDAMVEAYYRDYVAPEVLIGADVPPLDAMREQLRAALGESMRGAARDTALRQLHATVPNTNLLAARYAGISWEGPTPAAQGAGPTASTRSMPIGIAR